MLLTIAISAATALLDPGFYSVLSIKDGDTMRVQRRNETINVRLACIDAPESEQGLFGRQSREELLRSAPPGSIVRLRIMAKDRYGWSIAEVVRDGKSINKHMVSTGNAFAYREYIQNCDHQTYRRLESEARKENKGIWVIPTGIIRPWEYRRVRSNNDSKLLLPNPSPGAEHRDPFKPLPGRIQRQVDLLGPSKRYTCRAISSFSLAQVFLRQGHSYLDRDNDGVACEELQQ